MNKLQNDREMFYGICKFFSSNAWWRPIIEFIYSNSVCFLNSFEYSTEDEHNVYIQFMTMVVDLVDNYMCSKLHITSDAFENFMAQFLVKPNDKAVVIFQTLKLATDYNEFCHQMHICNKRIENSITRALLKFTEDKSISSTDELANLVAQQIEQDQEKEISDLVHKACVQSKKLMGINVLKSTSGASQSAQPLQSANTSHLNKVPSILTPTKIAPTSEIQLSLANSKNENNEDNEERESNVKSEKSKKAVHSHHSHHAHHAHHTRHSNKKLNKGTDQNLNTENSKNGAQQIVLSDINDMNDHKNSNVNKSIQNRPVAFNDDDYDENSDLSELTDEEESEYDLMSTFKKNQLRNKGRFNRCFPRPPLMQINRQNVCNQQKKTNVSFVFDSP